MILMIQGPNRQVNFYIVPQTWYGRLIATVVGAVLFILLIFFFTFFLIIFGLIAIITTIYIFFFGRKPEKASSTDIIQVEYLLANPQDEAKVLDQHKEKIPPGE